MFYQLARHFLFKLDPEVAHELTIKQLSLLGGTPLDIFFRQHVPSRPVQVMGLTFDNPVGLAAGLDARLWLLPAGLLLLAYPVRAWRDAPLFPTPPKGRCGLLVCTRVSLIQPPPKEIARSRALACSSLSVNI